MLLLIQLRDIKINPEAIQRVIQGSFNQKTKRFGQTASTQFMYSAGYMIIKKVHCWTTWDMNYILIAGNSL